MKNFDNVLNELVAKLLAEGSASFSQDGLNIKTSYDNGCMKITASFVSPKEDEETENLIKSFEEYVRSLNDDFFLEVVESFAGGELKKLQDMLDSKEPKAVRASIAKFMEHLKGVAAAKVDALNNDIEETEKELSDLIEIRDSYVHVLNKKF